MYGIRQASRQRTFLFSVWYTADMNGHESLHMTYNAPIPAVKTWGIAFKSIDYMARRPKQSGRMKRSESVERGVHTACVTVGCM